MIRIAVPASRSYEVLIAPGLLARLGALCREVCPSQRAMLVTDSRVAPLYLQKAASSLASAGFCVSTFVFPVGEKNKNGDGKRGSRLQGGGQAVPSFGY